MPFKNILINTPAVPSDSDALVMDAAVRIGAPCDAAITVFDVNSDLSWAMQYLAGGWEETVESIAGTKERRLERFAQTLRDRGLNASHSVAHGRLSAEIARHVSENGHDLVVKVAETSSNRSGFIGSTDMRLIHDCPCAVLILRPDEEAGFQHIAVAADILDQDTLQRDLNRNALVMASTLMATAAPISLVYALPPLRTAIRVDNDSTDVVSQEQLVKWDSDLRSVAEIKLERLASDVEDLDCHRHVLVGDPIEAIPEFTNGHGIDLLIIGSVPRNGIAGVLLGNTAVRILERVSCSVLVIKSQRPQSKNETTTCA
jgi:universal stress protein E